MVKSIRIDVEVDRVDGQALVKLDEQRSADLNNLSSEHKREDLSGASRPAMNPEDIIELALPDEEREKYAQANAFLETIMFGFGIARYKEVGDEALPFSTYIESFLRRFTEDEFSGRDAEGLMKELGDQLAVLRAGAEKVVGDFGADSVAGQAAHYALEVFQGHDIAAITQTLVEAGKAYDQKMSVSLNEDATLQDLPRTPLRNLAAMLCDVHSIIASQVQNGEDLFIEEHAASFAALQHVSDTVVRYIRVLHGETYPDHLPSYVKNAKADAAALLADPETALDGVIEFLRAMPASNQGWLPRYGYENGLRTVNVERTGPKLADQLEAMWKHGKLEGIHPDVKLIPASEILANELRTRAQETALEGKWTKAHQAESAAKEAPDRSR